MNPLTVKSPGSATARRRRLRPSP